MNRRWFLGKLVSGSIVAAGAAKAAESEVIGMGVQSSVSPIAEEYDPIESAMRKKFYELAGPKRARHEVMGYSIAHYPPHLCHQKSWGTAFRQSQYLQWKEEFSRDWGWESEHKEGHIAKLLKRMGVSW